MPPFKLSKKELLTLVEQAIREAFADATAAPPKKRQQQQQGALQQQPNQPLQFSIDTLKAFNDLGRVRTYVQATNLPLIGEGQGRMVYRLSNGRVLKVAKDQGGIGQNKAEAEVCDYAESMGLLPPVYETSPMFFWIVVAEAREATEQDFEKFAGMKFFQEFGPALKGAFPKQTTGITDYDQQMYTTYSKHPFFSKVVKAIQTCKYMPGDIAKLDSWGVAENKKLVIIDTGFTEAVSQQFYQKQGVATSK